MKLKLTAIWMILIALCAGHFAVAQDTSPLSPGPLGAPNLMKQDPALPPGVTGSTNLMPGATSPFGGSGFGRTSFRASPKEREINQKIREQFALIKGAKDSQAEEEATQKLRAALEDLFEERMKRRQSEIDSLKKRLEELEAKNNARQQKKGEIIDLKLKSLVNEAKGFGF